MSDSRCVQETLLHGEETIRTLFETAAQGILAMDVNGALVLVNRAAGEMFGYQSNELIGRPVEILFPERLPERHRLHRAAVPSHPGVRPIRLRLHLEGRRKDGANFPLEVGLSAIETAEGKLSVAFVSDITERNRLDTALNQSIQDIKTLVDNLPDVIIRTNREGRYSLMNATGLKTTGLPAESILGKTPREVGVPEQLCNLSDNARRTVLGTLRPTTEKWTYSAPLSEATWEARVHPEFDSMGAVESVLFILRDITEPRHLEMELEARRAQVEALAHSLIVAQEEERRRVARELHDQTCQQLASLAIDMGGLAADLPPPASMRARLKELQSRAVKASEQTRHLAHELHPAELDDLGLVASLRNACHEFSQRTGISVRFKKAVLPASVSGEIGSCLYRVAQESLQNVAKHAGATHVWVTLTFKKRTIGLSITDDGAGFDLAAVRGCGSLGLIGMEERVRLMKGKLSVIARPGHGTRIAVEIPLRSPSL